VRQCVSALVSLRVSCKQRSILFFDHYRVAIGVGHVMVDSAELRSCRFDPNLTCSKLAARAQGLGQNLIRRRIHKRGC